MERLKIWKETNIDYLLRRWRIRRTQNLLLHAVYGGLIILDMYRTRIVLLLAELQKLLNLKRRTFECVAASLDRAILKCETF